MSDSTQPGEEPHDDPEIAALLDFDPVPRHHKTQSSWTPELQRSFIARLAVHGSKAEACRQLGKDRGGVDKLYNSPEGASFRAAWDAALALAERRKLEQAAGLPGVKPPTLDGRRKWRVPEAAWVRQAEEDSEMARLAEEMHDRLRRKLLGCRRLYLQEIADSPGKRAAFEILTELPIDWEKAARAEAQADEPFNPANQRQPDMVLTAESGWTFGEAGYGPDKKAELRRAVDEHRAAEGLEPVDWEEE